MRNVIEITALTLKRLQNYQRVVDNELKEAHKLQWMEMTLQRMEEYQVALEKADQIGASVGYASILFRIQNDLTPDRILYGEHLLRNTLLNLLNKMDIPVVMINAPEEPLRSSMEI